jgi:Cu-processing system permease protein
MSALKNNSEQNLPQSWSVIRTFGRITFSEILRDKILYSAFFSALFLLGAAFLASRFSFVQPQRIVLDFGLSVLSLILVFLATFLAAPLLAREFDRRTAFLALSKPISRLSFLTGKYFGLVGILFVNWLLLSAVFSGVYIMVGGDFHPTLLWALVLAFWQSAILGALVLMVSTFTTTSLSAMIGVGFYLIGQNISQLRFLAAKSEDVWMEGFFNGLSWVLPNFEFYGLGTQVTYGLPVTWAYGLIALIYGVALIVIALFVSGVLIHRREI